MEGDRRQNSLIPNLEARSIMRPFLIQPYPGYPGKELILRRSFKPDALQKYNIGELNRLALVDAWAASIDGTMGLRKSLFNTVGVAFHPDGNLSNERLHEGITQYGKVPAWALVDHALGGGSFARKGSSPHEHLEQLHERKQIWLRGLSRFIYSKAAPALIALSTATETLSSETLQLVSLVGIGLLGFDRVLASVQNANNQTQFIQAFIDKHPDKNAFAVALEELHILSQLVTLDEGFLPATRKSQTVVRRIKDDDPRLSSFLDNHTSQRSQQAGQTVEAIGAIDDFPRPESVFELSRAIFAIATVQGATTQNKITQKVPSLAQLTEKLFDIPPPLIKFLLESIKAQPRRALEELIHVSPTLRFLIAGKIYTDDKTAHDLMVDGFNGEALGVRGFEPFAVKGHILALNAVRQDSHQAKIGRQLLDALKDEAYHVLFGGSKNGMRVLLPADVQTVLTSLMFMYYAPRNNGESKGTDHIVNAAKTASEKIESKTGLPGAVILTTLADFGNAKAFLRNVVDIERDPNKISRCQMAQSAIKGAQQDLISYLLGRIVGSTPKEKERLLRDSEKVKIMSFMLRELYQIGDPILVEFINQRLYDLAGTDTNQTTGQLSSKLLHGSGIYFDGIEYSDSLVDAFDYCLGRPDYEQEPNTYFSMLQGIIALTYGEAVHYLSTDNKVHHGRELKRYITWVQNYVRPNIISHLTSAQLMNLLTHLTSAISKTEQSLVRMGPHDNEDENTNDCRLKALTLRDLAISIYSSRGSRSDLLYEELNQSQLRLETKLNTT